MFFLEGERNVEIEAYINQCALLFFPIGYFESAFNGTR